MASLGGIATPSSPSSDARRLQQPAPGSIPFAGAEDGVISMSPPSRTARLAQAAAIRLGARPRIARLCGPVYALAARAGSALLTRGERGASVYVRGGLASGDLAPGLSDVDLVVVAPDSPSAARIRRRWLHLRRRRLPRLLLDWPRIHDGAELRELIGSSALTHPGAAYFGPGATLDGIRALERPGPAGIGSDWRLLRGPERRPTPGAVAADPIAIWLELVHLWRWVGPVCLDPESARSGDLAFKLVAGSAVLWAQLEGRGAAADRRAALELAGELLPGQRDGIAAALAPPASRPSRVPLELILPAAVALAARVAGGIASRLAPAGQTEVRLDGADAVPTPLCDWRAVACPSRADETLEVRGGRPSDPNAIAAIAAIDHGPNLALAEARLLVLPARSHARSRMRAIKAPFSDPVSFALISGASVAAFPEAAGWSARDWARRGVAEHRALLAGAPGVGGLTTAARAALLQESVEAGEPALAVTADAIAGRLAGRPGADAAAEAIGDGDPAPKAVAGLRALVTGLPAYRQAR